MALVMVFQVPAAALADEVEAETQESVMAKGDVVGEDAQTSWGDVGSDDDVQADDPIDGQDAQQGHDGDDSLGAASEGEGEGKDKEDEGGAQLCPVEGEGESLAIGWNLVDDAWYWSPDGIDVAHGWVRVGGKWYYLDPQSGAMMQGTTFTVDGRRYVAGESGACPASSWVWVGGSWYLTNASCAVRTGWAKVGGTWYYLDPETGSMRQDEVFSVGGKRYIANSSGACPSSAWVMHQGGWYLTDASCSLRTGWARVKGVWYYLDPSDGEMVHDRVFNVGGIDYVATSSGACPASAWVRRPEGWLRTTSSCSVAHGWARVGKRWYYLAEDTGLMQEQGFFEVDGKRYYARDDGSCPANGWIGIDGRWYRTNASCVVRVGWGRVGPMWFYFDPDEQGAAATGLRVIGGSEYYFHPVMGMMASSEYVTLEDGTVAYAGPDGRLSHDLPVPHIPSGSSGWVKVDGLWYYVEREGGQPVTGWLEVGGKRYWLGPDGAMVTGCQMIDGVAYSFSRSGALLRELDGGFDGVVSAARADLGYSVYDDPQTGSKFGRWYERTWTPLRGKVDFGADDVAFCVMGISYWLEAAGAGAPGFPWTGCEGVWLQAAREGRVVAPEDIEAGMLMLLDWEGDGSPDHIGLVEERVDGHTWKTIEANVTTTVNGVHRDGWVARMVRDIGDVYGAIVPYYLDN